MTTNKPTFKEWKADCDIPCSLPFSENRHGWLKMPLKKIMWLLCESSSSWHTKRSSPSDSATPQILRQKAVSWQPMHKRILNAFLLILSPSVWVSVPPHVSPVCTHTTAQARQCGYTSDTSWAILRASWNLHQVFPPKASSFSRHLISNIRALASILYPTRLGEYGKGVKKSSNSLLWNPHCLKTKLGILSAIQFSGRWW